MEFNLFWILVIALFIWLVKQNSSKKIKKLIGSFLIILGLYIVSFLPGFDDIILAPLFFSAMGWELSIEGIKANFLPYTLLTTIVGLVVAYAGIFLLDYKLKYLTNKIKRMFK